MFPPAVHKDSNFSTALPGIFMLAIVMGVKCTVSWFRYKFLCGCMFWFVLGIYLGVELLGDILTLCLTSVKLISKMAAALDIPASRVWGFQFLHINTNTCYYTFSILAIMVMITTTLSIFVAESFYSFSIIAGWKGINVKKEFINLLKYSSSIYKYSTYYKFTHVLLTDAMWEGKVLFRLIFQK